MEGFVKVATVDEIPEGGRKVVEVEDLRIAVFNCGGEYHAIADVCTHDGGPLAEGELLEGCQIQCPRHGARFDIRTGAALSFPAFEPTETYRVVVQEDEIWVENPFAAMEAYG